MDMKGHWKKRTAALVLAAALCSGCMAGQDVPASAQNDGLELTILHVNDTHSHVAGIDARGNAAFAEEGSRGGLGRIAAAVARAKARNDNVLALDAGDQFQGTLYYSVNGWPMLAEMNRHIPYDAMTLGNHEFDEGCLELSRFIRQSPVPVLAANLAPEGGCPLLGSGIAPFLVREIRGVRVGVIGLASNRVRQSAAACPDTHFTDTVDTLKKYTAELERLGVRHVVALTHLGLPADRELARAVDGVDVIVGGHTHSYLGPDSPEGPYPVVERSPSGNPVLVVTAKRATRYLGELRVKFDEAGIPVAWSGAARELRPEDPRCAEISALVHSYTDTLNAFRETVVGSQNIDMPDGMDACREGDCLGGMVTTDAMLEYARPYGASIALCNGGAIRAAFPRGPVSRGDILTMHPFGNKIVVREYSGRQIRDALEHGVSGEAGKGARLLQAAGLRYRVDADRPAGSRILEVEVLDERGTASPLDPKARYGVVTPDYLSRGGDGYDMLRDGVALPSPEPLDASLVERYLRSRSPLPPPVGGRIIRVQ